MKNIKERLLPYIANIEIKHQRARDYKAKISRYDDCFGLVYDDNCDECKVCTMTVFYDGKEMKINSLCKRLMGIPLVEVKEETQEQKQQAKKGETPVDVDVVTVVTNFINACNADTGFTTGSLSKEFKVAPAKITPVLQQLLSDKKIRIGESVGRGCRYYKEIVS